MGFSKLASAVLTCGACLACGGSAGQDDAVSNAGSAGALAVSGGANRGGGANETGSATGGSATSGGATSGSAASGGAANGGNTNLAGSDNGGTATSSGGNPSAGGRSGSSGSGGISLEEYPGPGTVTAPWKGLCVATFTVDYAVADAFKKPLFTAHAGEQYLVVRYFADFSATLGYLTPSGPLEFGVTTDVDVSLPFTSNCSPRSEANYVAVFADLSVFAEPGLTVKLCDLANGTTVARDLSKLVGFSLETNSGANAVYELDLNAFSARCGGADKGYIRVTALSLFGSGYSIVPFRLILGPQ